MTNMEMPPTGPPEEFTSGPNELHQTDELGEISMLTNGPNSAARVVGSVVLGASLLAGSGESSHQHEEFTFTPGTTSEKVIEGPVQPGLIEGFTVQSDSGDNHEISFTTDEQDVDDLHAQAVQTFEDNEGAFRALAESGQAANIEGSASDEDAGERGGLGVDSELNTHGVNNDTLALERAEDERDVLVQVGGERGVDLSESFVVSGEEDILNSDEVATINELADKYGYEDTGRMIDTFNGKIEGNTAADMPDEVTENLNELLANRRGTEIIFPDIHTSQPGEGGGLGKVTVEAPGEHTSVETEHTEETGTPPNPHEAIPTGSVDTVEGPAETDLPPSTPNTGRTPPITRRRQKQNIIEKMKRDPNTPDFERAGNIASTNLNKKNNVAGNRKQPLPGNYNSPKGNSTGRRGLKTQQINRRGR